MKSIPWWPENTFTICHIDETGLIDTDPDQRFYGIGLLKLNSACLYNYYQDIQIIKSKTKSIFKEFSEFKCNYISRGGIDLYKQLIDVHFKYKDAMFCGLVIDKNHPDVNVKSYFKNSWDAHVRYSVQAVKNNVMPQELTHVIADKMNRRKGSAYFFDVELEKIPQVIFAGMEESKNNLIIQVSDVLIGLVVLNFRMKYSSFSPPTYKLEVLNYLKQKLATEDLAFNFNTLTPNYFSVWPFIPYHK